MADPSTTPSRGRSSRWRTAQTVLAVVLGVVVLGYCASLVFVGVFAGASVQWDPNDATDLERWTSALAYAAELTRRRALEAALVIAVLAAMAAVAAVLRSKIWLTFGTISGAMLLTTVIALNFTSESTLSALVEQTHERIGPVHLVPESGDLKGSGVQSYTNGVEDAAGEAFSVDDAEQEMGVLIEAALAGLDGPATTSVRMSAPPQELDAAHPPIERRSCAPAQAESLGEQLTLGFTIPSDDHGRTKQRVLASWAAAGYAEVVEEGRRDESVVRKSGDSAMYSISVDDRFTIDGMLTIWLESRCL
ncbi:hypothetical protein FB468_0091 [Leucobacter komagatae]|uniref:Uncharacterized protein n=1 Tax=Leucobacter komagatae TaxID=55969 RepID=A0A542Y203_9MICO|nr:hypothetical protein [Leucobacter komagatae]TQL42110.1 hypothetical protein FB468_0091 [Leucobacter komagatae]